MPFGSSLSSEGDRFVEALFGSDYLKDYKHASKTFLADGYSLAPQTKFLFHVYFTLNTSVIPGLAQTLGQSAADRATIGMLVKTAELPRYTVDVNDLNQYNRKRYVQTKINYQPTRITFHDDGSDLVRSMWYNYYTYYYGDSKHEYDGIRTNPSTGLNNRSFDYNRRDIYDNLRNVVDWGYQGASTTEYKHNFFKDIKIYGLNRGNFVQYTLINPIITDWSHDTFDYGQGGGVMENTMTIKYETVKYSRGQIRRNNLGQNGVVETVRGFGDPATYDRTPSALSKPGATETILGQAGLVDAGLDIVEDLANGNILGAVLSAGTAYNTFENSDFSNLIEREGEDAIALAAAAALTNPAVQNAVGGINNFVFPVRVAEPTEELGNSETTTYSNNGQTSVNNAGTPNANYLTGPSSGSDVVPWPNPDQVISNGQSVQTQPYNPNNGNQGLDIE